MTEAVEENARLLEMSKTDYYRLKNGQVIEGPTYPTSAKVLSLEELRALNPNTLITAKYYSARRGGVARHKLTVRQIILPKAEGTPIKLYRTTRGFAEDAALRTDLETKQGYKLYATFNTPEAMQEAASRLAGQDLKFVKHISTTNVSTWEIYAKQPSIVKDWTKLRDWELKLLVDKGYEKAIEESKRRAGETKTPQNLYWYSISNLKQMCRRRGLSTEGSKEDLIRRLKRL